MSDEANNPIQWTIHDAHPDLVKSLRDALVQVMDPEIGMNIIQLGLIRQVEIENDIVKMHMILTTPFCPYGPALIESARQKAQEALSRPVTIELGMEMWVPSMMEDPGAIDWGMYT